MRDAPDGARQQMRFQRLAVCCQRVDRLALREPIDAYAQTIAGALNLKLDADIRGVALPAGSGWDYDCVLGGHGS